jgi:hypothetical protein
VLQRAGGRAAPAVNLDVIYQNDFNQIRNIPAGDLFMHEVPAFIPPRFSREDWFMYFWREAQGAWGNQASAQQTTDATAFFNRAFKKKADFGQNVRVGNGQAARMVRSNDVVPRGRFENLFSDAELMSALEMFLKVGFDSFEAPINAAVDHGRYIKMIDKKIGFEIRWRTEDRRGYDELRKDGIQKQAVDAKRKTDINCDQPWHPFSKKANNSKLWYRRMSLDNEWYCVVSVALDWQTSVCYPKIDQTPKLQIMPANQVVNEELMNKYPELIHKVEFYDSSTIEHRLVTRSKLALLLVDGMIFDTRQKQSDDAGAETSYPEQGMCAIDGKSVIGVIELLRVHHGLSDADGFTAVVDEKASTGAIAMDFGANSLLRAIGNKQARDNMWTSVKAAWDEPFKSKGIHLRWMATGYEQLAQAAKKRAVRRIYSKTKQIWP